MAISRKLGAFKTSMLQDVEAGRAIVEQVAKIVIHLLQQQQAQRRREDEAERLEPLAQNVPVERVQW